jgi:hypothetical protein
MISITTRSISENVLTASADFPPVATVLTEYPDLPGSISTVMAMIDSSRPVSAHGLQACGLMFIVFS